MKPKSLRWRRWGTITVGILGVTLLHTAAAAAFDTGHHADLTRSALQEEGFNDTSIKVVQLDNWLVDYYSNTKTDLLKPSIAVIKDDSDKLHFDNLYSTTQVTNYWGHLARNARRAIHAAAKQNEPLQGITLLGVSLHAVQDFYTHSNWVETHPRTANSYRTDTFFDTPPGTSVDLFTGYYPNEPQPSAGREPHGEYKNGLNHDAYGRPRWDEAYIYAYVASRQWTQAMHAWANEVNPNFWSQMQKLAASQSDAADLERDLNASYRISEWVAVGANGHWKGSGSGSSEFLPFSVNWARQSDSIYLKAYKDKRVYAPLIEGLVNNNALRNGEQISKAEGAAPTVPQAQFSQRAVIVRTLHVEELPVGFFELKLDPGGKADFFGRITVAGQTFVEAMQLDQSSVDPPWTTIRFLSAHNPAPITYALWDEDGGTGGDDDHCDINPASGKLNLDFTFDLNSHQLLGDLTGVHDSNGNAATSTGAAPDKDRARLRFFVTAVSLTPTAAK